MLNKRQGKYSEAEEQYKRALAICEKVLGNEHPQMERTLSNLANLYGTLNNYNAAEKLQKRAMAISEKAWGIDHPHTATALSGLAVIYKNQSKYDEAEMLQQRALAIRKKILGLEHPDTVTTVNELALIKQLVETKDLQIPFPVSRNQSGHGAQADTGMSLENLAAADTRTPLENPAAADTRTPLENPAAADTGTSLENPAPVTSTQREHGAQADIGTTPANIDGHSAQADVGTSPENWNRELPIAKESRESDNMDTLTFQGNRAPDKNQDHSGNIPRSGNTNTEASAEKGGLILPYNVDGMLKLEELESKTEVDVQSATKGDDQILPYNVDDAFELEQDDTMVANTESTTEGEGLIHPYYVDYVLQKEEQKSNEVNTESITKEKDPILSYNMDGMIESEELENKTEIDAHSITKGDDPILPYNVNDAFNLEEDGIMEANIESTIEEEGPYYVDGALEEKEQKSNEGSAEGITEEDPILPDEVDKVDEELESKMEADVLPFVVGDTFEMEQEIKLVDAESATEGQGLVFPHNAEGVPEMEANNDITTVGENPILQDDMGRAHKLSVDTKEDEFEYVFLNFVSIVLFQTSLQFKICNLRSRSGMPKQTSTTG
ncbi:hypothetical protein BC938DRAFT_480109 [Jimgerdemannia flammicorona]|uniref:Uncharacterized protein n=1 Tax=Jimgerdemannia flammicorona TaxID=994334 RepID=A0A433QXS1_9FUNG|nr:hypothetical protein BC938DRAFT_480109 [Jimgerdemannia flammicorona]